MQAARLTRRAFLASSATVLSVAAQSSRPTRFQIACMTLPYSQFPMPRAIQGIARAGFRQIAWGTTHLEGGMRRPALAVDAPAADAKLLASRCRDAGLEPVMMFSTVQIEEPGAAAAHLQHIDQTAATRVPIL